MLILSRKQGQSVVINGNVLVKVHRISGNVVSLAFDAPREVQIARIENGVPVNNSNGGTMQLSENVVSRLAADSGYQDNG